MTDTDDLQNRLITIDMESHRLLRQLRSDTALSSDLKQRLGIRQRRYQRQHVRRTVRQLLHLLVKGVGL